MTKYLQRIEMQAAARGIELPDIREDGKPTGSRPIYIYSNGDSIIVRRRSSGMLYWALRILKHPDDGFTAAPPIGNHDVCDLEQAIVEGEAMSKSPPRKTKTHRPKNKNEAKPDKQVPNPEPTPSSGMYAQLNGLLDQRDTVWQEKVDGLATMIRQLQVQLDEHLTMHKLADKYKKP